MLPNVGLDRASGNGDRIAAQASEAELPAIGVLIHDPARAAESSILRSIQGAGGTKKIDSLLGRLDPELDCKRAIWIQRRLVRNIDVRTQEGDDPTRIRKPETIADDTGLALEDAAEIETRAVQS